MASPFKPRFASVTFRLCGDGRYGCTNPITTSEGFCDDCDPTEEADHLMDLSGAAA